MPRREGAVTQLLHGRKGAEDAVEAALAGRPPEDTFVIRLPVDEGAAMCFVLASVMVLGRRHGRVYGLGLRVEGES